MKCASRTLLEIGTLVGCQSRMNRMEEERFLGGSGTKLLLLAHPDDESIAASFFLQRQSNAYVVFATSGDYATPEKLKQLGLLHSYQYAVERKQEALNALGCLQRLAGRHFLQFPDSQLHLCLPEFFRALSNIVMDFKPELVLTHALEAQHIDHDSCSFVASRIRARLGIPIWEMPLYHSRGGNIVAQQFREGTSISTVEVIPSSLEIEVKKRMLGCHRTQVTLGVFRELGIDAARPERFRPQRAYDYLDLDATLPAMTRSISKLEIN